MINAGDKVEEIATGRRGVIEKILSNGPSGRSIPYEWHVVFVVDGKEPSRLTFSNEKELKSLMDETDEGGLYPAGPIQK